jgi:peroxiredoxin
MRSFKYRVFFSTIFVLALIFNNFLLAQKVEDFSLKDYNGKSVSLSDYKDAKAIVIMFIATQCPVSNAYNERMVNLYDEFNKKGIAFVAVNSNKQEKIDDIKIHATEHKFSFPVVKDDKNIVADKYNAQVTPEVFVVNTDLELLYHGAIDDSKREGEVESHSLKNALNEVLASKRVSVEKTKAFGCSIKRID